MVWSSERSGSKMWESEQSDGKSEHSFGFKMLVGVPRASSSVSNMSWASGMSWTRSPKQTQKPRVNGSKKTTRHIRDLIKKASIESGPLPDIIQFSTAVYYCEEAEGSVEVQVVRLGEAFAEACVEMYSADKSAKAGIKYTPISEVLTFAPGERAKTFSIPLADNDSYDSIVEFEVHLDNPEGAILGPCLQKCKVVIVDNDTFPTNRFATRLRNARTLRDASLLPTWQLMMEYIRMHLHDTTLRRRCVQFIFLDQVANLKYLWGLFLTLWLIDGVLRPVEGSIVLPWPLDQAGPDKAVLMIVIGYIVPYPVLLAFDLYKARLRIAGLAIAHLQQNLMRRYLNLDENSFYSASSSELNMAISREVPELVRRGFCVGFQILQKLGLLVLLLGAALVQAKWDLWITFALFFGFPLFMIVFLQWRRKGSSKRRKELFMRETEIIEFTQRVSECYRLIADYAQRTERVTSFTTKVKACNAANTKLVTWSLVNVSFAPLLTMVIICTYILLLYRQVLARDMLIGQFCAGIAIWKGIGQCYQQIYEHLLTMQDAIDPLHHVTFFMNLPIAAPSHMQRSRWLLSQGSVAVTSAQEQVYGSNKVASHSFYVSKSCFLGREELQDRVAYSEDLLLLRCRNLKFSYVDHVGTTISTPIKRASFELKQGQLVAITGPRGGGKATLLRVLGGVHLPAPSEAPGEGLFIPPHLRILHVDYPPRIISDLGIFDNLCFGSEFSAPVSDAGDRERMAKICRRLGVAEELVKLMESEACAADGVLAERNALKWRALEMMSNDGILLSQTDKCLIHIARALILNPEVLILHKPLIHFDSWQARRVVNVLREFVDMRGVEKAEEDRRLRRPRTCIYSASATEGTETSDMVLQICDGEITTVDVDELHKLRKQCYTLFQVLDRNEDQYISLEEFLNRVPQASWIMRIMGISEKQTNSETEELTDILTAIFNAVDTNADKNLDVDELVHYLHRLVVDENALSDKSTTLSPSWQRDICEEGQPATVLGRSEKCGLDIRWGSERA